MAKQQRSKPMPDGMNVQVADEGLGGGAKLDEPHSAHIVTLGHYKEVDSRIF